MFLINCIIVEKKLSIRNSSKSRDQQSKSESKLQFDPINLMLLKLFNPFHLQVNKNSTNSNLSLDLENDSEINEEIGHQTYRATCEKLIQISV